LYIYVHIRTTFFINKGVIYYKKNVVFAVKGENKNMVNSWDSLAQLLTDLFNAGISVWNTVLTGDNATSIIYGIVVIGILIVVLYIPEWITKKMKR